MRFSLRRYSLVTALAALFAGAGAVQAAGYLDPVVGTSVQGGAMGNWQPFVSVTPVWQGNANLDSGGDFSVRGGVRARRRLLRLRRRQSRGHHAQLRLSRLLVLDPELPGREAAVGHHPALRLYDPALFEVGDGWSVGAAPSVDWIRENGADSGESVTWGALVSGTKRFDDGNRLGLGVGVYDRIETTKVFPFLIVDWRLGERWRVINPLPSGPTGPAGLDSTTSSTAAGRQASARPTGSCAFA